MTGVTRFLVSVVGAALTLFVYGYALIEAERRLGYEAMHFLNYQLILLLFVPLFICAVWSVAPNVFRKFDRWLLVARLFWSRCSAISRFGHSH